MSARVTKVDVAKQRATLDRGTKAGLRLGDVGELFPVRGVPTQKVTFEERLARGKVVEIHDNTAVLALAALADTVDVGAYFAYKADVSDELAKSSLFNVIAIGVELRLQTQTDDKPLITVEAMLADPSAALRDKALDAMIDEMKVNKAFFDKSVPTISGGKHRGKTGGKVIDELTRAELLDCFLYVESYYSGFAGHRWKVPELYFTWVVSGAESGERERKLKLLRPTIEAARNAARVGKLDDARMQWEAVLRAMPDHKDARTEVERIYNLQLWMRQLAADPDDTMIRSQLAFELFQVEDFTAALQHVDLLVKAKYQPYDTAKYRAKLLARFAKWRDAEQAFERLAKERPSDTNVHDWIEYVKIKSRLERSQDDPAARLALAEHAYRREDWGWALQEYRRVLEAKAVTAAQRAAVKGAQRRIVIQNEVATQIGWARGAIERHDIPTARRHVDAAMKLLDDLGDVTRTSAVLADLASAAHMSYESDFNLELLERRAAQTKDDAVTYALAFALNIAGRYDEAEATAKKAAKPDPYFYAMVARARGDHVELERQAMKGAAAQPKAVWPQRMLVAVEATRGHWQDAVGHARNAQRFAEDPADISIRTTLNASLRGLQAHEALQADPASARERLRLVRALANLRLVQPAAAEIAKLPADGMWRSEGWWAITASDDFSVPLTDQLMAARNAKPTTPARKRVLARLEAQTKLQRQPKDEATRIAFAKLLLENSSASEALAVLGPLMVAPVKPAVATLANDARETLEMAPQRRLVGDAIRRKDYAGAMRVALAAQALADRIGDVLARSSARESRINILEAQGRYEEAIAIAKEANAIVHSDGDPWVTVVGDWHVARLQAKVGTNEMLRQALVAGLKICEDIDNDICLQTAHRELGELAFDDGSYAEGIEHARRAWTLADRLGTEASARGARLQLANLDLAAQRTADAEQLLVKLLVDSRKALDTDDEQKTLLMLGLVASARGQGKAARARYHEVYDLGTRIGHTPWRALARKLEGSAWLHADHDPAKASIALEQAAALLAGAADVSSIEMRSSTLRLLADARLQQRQLAKAREGAEQSLAIEQQYQHRSSVARSHVLLAKIAIAEGNTASALASAKAGLDLATRTDESELLAEAWHLLAQAQVMNMQDTEAADSYGKALDQRARTMLAVGGESDREAYLGTSDVRELYIDAAEHYLKVGKSTRAMEVLEQSRDAQLKHAFDPTAVQTTDPKLRARLDAYEKERAHVQALQKQLGDANNKPGAQRSDAQVKALGALVAKGEQNLKGVAADLKGSNNVLYRLMVVDPQSLMDRRSKLMPGAVIVEYFMADDALYAFVISAALKQPSVVRVNVTSIKLTQTIADFRDALVQAAGKEQAQDKVESFGRKLEDWLLQPLRKQLDGASTVIVVPFGALNYVPFDALVVSDPGKSVRYAIEDYRFSVQTAMTVERLLEDARPRATGTLLAIANPDGSLPGAQREVARIVKSVPDARVLAGKAATLKKFTDVVGGFRYVHVASHGILEPGAGKSYLKLADAPLTVSTISSLNGLRTSTELVVLSACESALARSSATSTDDLMSLADGFAWAGAPAIVASLWKVDDESTAELMATFYRALEANRSDRLDSLRDAKLNLLRFKHGKATPFSAPWHWASFQLYGDFRAPKN